jgi:hypothetical protein
MTSEVKDTIVNKNLRELGSTESSGKLINE